jgi:hypothetical protein
MPRLAEHLTWVVETVAPCYKKCGFISGAARLCYDRRAYLGAYEFERAIRARQGIEFSDLKAVLIYGRTS